MLGLIGLGCGPKAVEEKPATSPSGQPPALDLGAALREADLRGVGAALRDALLSKDAQTRALATRALSAIRTDEARALLRAALQSADPAVRRLAADGLASATERDVLAGAFVAERDPGVRARLLEALSRSGSTVLGPAILDALADSSAEVRAAGCRSATRAVEGENVSRETEAGLFQRAISDPDRTVRVHCAAALSRVPHLRDPAALTAMLAHADTDVRYFAFRALRRNADAVCQPPATCSPEALIPTRLIELARAESDWRVSVAAYEALAELPGRYGLEAGTAVLDRGIGPPDFQAPRLHVIVAALRALGSKTGPNHPAQLDRWRLTLIGLGRTVEERGVGLAHCEVAVALDALGGTLANTTQCGLGRVGPSEQMRFAVRALLRHKTVRPADVALIEQAGGRAWEDLLSGSWSHAPDVPARVAMFEKALRTDREGVLTSACEGLESLAPKPEEVSLLTPLDPLLAHALTRLNDRNAIEGVLACLRGAEVFRAQLTAINARPLARHWHPLVRAAAIGVLAKTGVSVPQATQREIPNPIDAAVRLTVGAKPKVLIETSTGSLEVELRDDIAPTTVARFLTLVDRGFFTNLAFHRVVPGFVAQGGDPQGDGYGGPGYVIRCENTVDLPFERGTLGMALAGRDTGGSQFFIAQGAFPHLDGEYSSFGRVIRGIDALDRLIEGDRILRITRIP